MLTFAWQQFRMELDDRDVQPPVWVLKAVRVQREAFVVSPLPDDHPLKPAAVKALASGDLAWIELEDDEIVALYDDRGAIRPFEPTLTQLPRGPAIAECPRTPQTRGAGFEYF